LMPGPLVVGLVVSSTTAVTVTVPDCKAHVVGTFTEVIFGPKRTQLAPSHVSAGSQTCEHVYAHRPSLQVAPMSSPPSTRLQFFATQQAPSDASPLSPPPT